MQEKTGAGAVIDAEFLKEMEGGATERRVIDGRARTELEASGPAADRAAAQERSRIAAAVRHRSVAMAPGMLADLIEAGAL